MIMQMCRGTGTSIFLASGRGEEEEEEEEAPEIFVGFLRYHGLLKMAGVG